MKAYTQNESFLRHAISAPFIYSVIIGLFILDVLVELYHRVCFPMYGIDLVPREVYIKIDRHKLRYLTWFQKINCVYCGYANGLLRYASEIAGATEAYWCGIKHREDGAHKLPEYQEEFLDYADEEAFIEYMKK